MALLALLSACHSVAGSDAVCTGVAVPAIQLEVRDAADRAPAGREARAIARDGAFADTARPYVLHGYEDQVLTFMLAFERRGTYLVTVERAGYMRWERAGVRVDGNECHVRPVELTALLQRLPGPE